PETRVVMLLRRQGRADHEGRRNIGLAPGDFVRRNRLEDALVEAIGGVVRVSAVAGQLTQRMAQCAAQHGASVLDVLDGAWRTQGQMPALHEWRGGLKG